MSVLLKEEEEEEEVRKDGEGLGAGLVGGVEMGS